MQWPFNDNFEVLIKNSTTSPFRIGSWGLPAGETVAVPWHVCTQYKRVYRALQDTPGFYFMGFLIGGEQFLTEGGEKSIFNEAVREPVTVKVEPKRSSENVEPPAPPEKGDFMFEESAHKTGVKLSDVTDTKKSSSSLEKYKVKEREEWSPHNSGKIDPHTLEPVKEAPTRKRETPRGSGRVDPTTLEEIPYEDPLANMPTAIELAKEALSLTKTKSYDKMTRKELAKRLKDRGLASYGTKKEMIARLNA